jgi:carbamoyl-phosphate synthase large subunit
MNASVLICSAGRRVALVKSFQESLSNLGLEGGVFTTDLAPLMSAACQASDKAFKVGRFADANYIEHLLHLCIENNIKIVVPTIDSELLLLAANKALFASNGVEIIVSNLDFVTICRDKRLTNAFFAENNIRIPSSIDPFNPTFPLFAKPISGSMSKDIMLFQDASMFDETLKHRTDLMFMEYIPKEEYDEYTLDLYYDKHGLLKCVVPRLRIEIRTGEISKGLLLKNSLIPFIQERLHKIEGARGCLTLQLFKGKQHDNVVGIEINPRFGGGYPMSYAAGANYPAWIIQEYLLDQPISWFNDWEDNLLCLRYDKEVLVHGYQIQ